MTEKKMICAPMATLSHEAFRRSVEKFGGCDEYFTEMINASSLMNMGPFEKYYLFDGPAPEKIVWQITGWDGEDLGRAAEVLSEKNGIGIDINMGCSAPQIFKTGAGIAWMLKPLEETRNAVRQVKKNCGNKRLSVKCRLGDEKFTEESFFNFTDMLVDEGVSVISIHPRTMKEKYRDLPKYEYAEKLAKRYENKIQVYVNGAVCDRRTLEFVEKKVPGSMGIMIARAAAEKPWIFHELKEGTGTDQVDRQQVCLDFINDVKECQPPEFWKTRIQRFFGYYCQQFKFGHYFQSKMQNYKSIEDSIFQINDFFEKQPEEKFIFI